MAAFEISAENPKKRENNKREQARPKKISDLSKASDFISQQRDNWHDRSRRARQIKKPGASPG
jgi:hypothetical protein